MKRALAFPVVLLALGVWAGVHAEQSGWTGAEVETGLAIALGFNLLFCLWLWYRAPPGSGDAMVLPVVVLLSAAMLLGILPRVFWPAAEGIHLAGSIAGLVTMTLVLVVQIRRRRHRRKNARVL
jgi:hypothetical protein